MSVLDVRVWSSRALSRRARRSSTLIAAIPEANWVTMENYPDTCEAQLAETTLNSFIGDQGRGWCGRKEVRDGLVGRERVVAGSGAGMLTLAEITEQLRVQHPTIKAWRHPGLLTSRKANDRDE
jgi:hypothetical protein